MRRILMASAMGAAIGLSFAILKLLANTSPQFVEFMQHRLRPALVLPMSLLTGAIDGVLIAYLWKRNDSTNTYASP